MSILCHRQRMDVVVGECLRARTPRPPPDSLRGTDEGRRARSYWSQIQEWHGAMGWNWTEPDGQKRWVGYLPAAYRETLIQESHEGRVASHLGIERMIHMLQRTWYWPGMTKPVWTWIAASVNTPPCNA